MTVQLEPLAVYDTRDDSFKGLWGTPGLAQLIAWAESEGILTGRTYRLEIYLLDCLFARVYEYEKDADGHVLLNAARTGAALREPYDRPITCMPPVPPATEAP